MVKIRMCNRYLEIDYGKLNIYECATVEELAEKHRLEVWYPYDDMNKVIVSIRIWGSKSKLYKYVKELSSVNPKLRIEVV